MKIYEKQHSLWDKVINAFLPERCPYCNKVINLGDLYCDECPEKFNGITYHTYARGGYHTVSAVPYTDMFADAIKRFKFGNGKQHAFQLARIMAEAVANEYSSLRFDMISFVPLHPKKYRQRGYNQSELLAKELSKLLDIPLHSTLKKTRDNQPQHTIKNAQQREINVKGAYRITDKSIIKNKRILLVDDIITTGNTLGECARVLDSKGALSIHCVTFAIAVVKTT